jgi:VanZ family protein
MRWAAAIGFAGFIGWIIYLADTGSPSRILTFVRTIPFGDKLGHFFLYGVLSFLLILAMRHRSWIICGRPIALGALIVMGFAIFEEITQAFLPRRNFDALDIVADFLGVACFTWIANRLISKPMPMNTD